MNLKVSGRSCFSECDSHVVEEVAVAGHRIVGDGDGWYERLMIPGRSQGLRYLVVAENLVVAETWHNKGASFLERGSAEEKRGNEVIINERKKLRGLETKAGQRVKTCTEAVGPAKE